MPGQHNILGTLCILLGILLFAIVAGTWVFQLLLLFIAYQSLNYGLALKGLPPASYYVKRWLNENMRGF